MKNTWKGHYKGHRRIRLFVTIYINTYQLVDGKTGKFCIVWKEDKSRQNDTIKSLWNSPTQMTLSHKYDLEEYSPSFWILKQNSWSEMRYPVDNFDLAVPCWDEKNSLFAFLPWYNMFDSIHPTPAPPNPSPLQTKILHNLCF